VPDAGAEPAPLDALLDLAVAARVHDDDDVEIRIGDLIQVSVEDARAVLRPQ
jgi:hypothetical protein